MTMVIETCKLKSVFFYKERCMRKCGVWRATSFALVFSATVQAENCLPDTDFARPGVTVGTTGSLLRFNASELTARASIGYGGGDCDSITVIAHYPDGAEVGELPANANYFAWSAEPHSTVDATQERKLFVRATAGLLENTEPLSMVVYRQQLTGSKVPGGELRAVIDSTGGILPEVSLVLYFKTANSQRVLGRLALRSESINECFNGQVGFSACVTIINSPTDTAIVMEDDDDIEVQVIPQNKATGVQLGSLGGAIVGNNNHSIEMAHAYTEYE